MIFKLKLEMGGEGARDASCDHPVHRGIADVGEHGADNEGGQDGSQQPEQRDQGKACRGPDIGLQTIGARRVHFK